MGITGGGLDLGVTEELADHGQAHALGDGVGGKGMAKVMDAHVHDPGALADALPELLDFFSVGAWDLTANHPRVIGLPFEVGKQIEGRGAKMHNSGSGLGIG